MNHEILKFANSNGISLKEIEEIQNGEICINTDYEEFKEYLKLFIQSDVEILAGGVVFPKWFLLLLVSVISAPPLLSEGGCLHLGVTNSFELSPIKLKCQYFGPCTDEIEENIILCDNELKYVKPTQAQQFFTEAIKVKNAGVGAIKAAETVSGLSIMPTLTIFATAAITSIAKTALSYFCRKTIKPSEGQVSDKLVVYRKPRSRSKTPSKSNFVPLLPSNRGRGRSRTPTRHKDLSAGFQEDLFSILRDFDQNSLRGGIIVGKCSNLGVLATITAAAALMCIIIIALKKSEVYDLQNQLNYFKAVLSDYANNIINPRNLSGQAETILESFVVQFKILYELIKDEINNISSTTALYNFIKNYFPSNFSVLEIGTKAKQFYQDFIFYKMITSNLYKFVKFLLYYGINAFSYSLTYVFAEAKRFCENYYDKNPPKQIERGLLKEIDTVFKLDLTDKSPRNKKRKSRTLKRKTSKRKSLKRKSPKKRKTTPKRKTPQRKMIPK